MVGLIIRYKKKKGVALSERADERRDWQGKMLHIFLCLPALLSVQGCVSALVFWNVEGAQGVDRIK